MQCTNIMDYIIKTGSNNFWSKCFLQQSQKRRIHGLNKNGELRCLMFSDLLMTLQVNYCIKTLHKKITQHEKMHFACTRSELITHLQLNCYMIILFYPHCTFSTMATSKEIIALKQGSIQCE